MDLNRQSMYDIMKENFEKYNRKTYIHRLTYIFGFDNEGYAVIRANFCKLAKIQYSHYYDECLTGMLFIYRDTVGIHIIEGSDSTLLKHIKLIFANTEVFGNAKNVVCKLVTIQTHIKTRLLSSWSSMEIISSYPSETIIIAPEEEEMYSLYKTLLKNLSDATELLMRNSIEQEEFLDGGYIFNLMSKILPPAQMLHRLLYFPILQDLKVFRNERVIMPEGIPYHEAVWPLPVDYVPHHSEVLLKQKKTIYLDEKK